VPLLLCPFACSFRAGDWFFFVNFPHPFQGSTLNRKPCPSHLVFNVQYLLAATGIHIVISLPLYAPRKALRGTISTLFRRSSYHLYRGPHQWYTLWAGFLVSLFSPLFHGRKNALSKPIVPFFSAESFEKALSLALSLRSPPPFPSGGLRARINVSEAPPV